TLNEDQTLTIAPTPGITSLTMVSQPGDYIGQGQTYSYTPQTGTFMVNRNFDNGVSIYYSGGGHSWNLDFPAPFDATLTPGTYSNATRWPPRGAGDKLGGLTASLPGTLIVPALLSACFEQDRISALTSGFWGASI